MVLLLGATGFVGQAFARELRRRGHCFVPLSRSAFDYARFDLLFDYVRRIRPTLVINAACASGQTEANASETDRMVTFQANTLLPQTIARVCAMTKTPLGHASTGCMFSGAKMLSGGSVTVEPDLTMPRLRRLFETQPEIFTGYTEYDEPNITFRNGPCSFSAGTRALAEESLRNTPHTYIWRHLSPFNEMDSACNLLTRLQHEERILDQVSSFSHVDDYAAACLQLFEFGAAFGTYNVVNSGATTVRAITELIRKKLKLNRTFSFYLTSSELKGSGRQVEQCGAILDNSKLIRAGVRIRDLHDALADALEHWIGDLTNSMDSFRLPRTPAASEL